MKKSTKKGIKKVKRIERSQKKKESRTIKAIKKLKETETHLREKVKGFKKGSKNYRKSRNRISEVNYQIRLREKAD